MVEVCFMSLGGIRPWVGEMSGRGIILHRAREHQRSSGDAEWQQQLREN